jgi:hypothetical protein
MLILMSRGLFALVDDGCIDEASMDFSRKCYFYPVVITMSTRIIH